MEALRHARTQNTRWSALRSDLRQKGIGRRVGPSGLKAAKRDETYIRIECVDITAQILDRRRRRVVWPAPGAAGPRLKRHERGLFRSYATGLLYDLHRAGPDGFTPERRGNE